MLNTILQFVLANPRQTGAVICGCLLPTAFLWRLEYSLPDKMGATWMRLLLLFGSILLGPLACSAVWGGFAGVVPGLIGGLLSEGVRQLALYFLSKKFPGLTSIPQAILKVHENGDVGIKVGEDPTVMLSAQQKAELLKNVAQTTPGNGSTGASSVGKP